MKLTRTLIKGILFLYCFLKFKSIKMAYALAFQNAGIKQIQGLKREGQWVVFQETGNKIAIVQLTQFEFSINHLIELLQNHKVTVLDAKQDSFIAQIAGLKFKVASLSNMAVLYEVFKEEIYGVHLLKQDLLVLDIGMNVGVASHFFANNPQVKAVHGFEPFPQTFQEATANLALNPQLQDKLFMHPYGVSNVSETREITLFDSGLLSASTMASDNSVYGKQVGKTVEVYLRSMVSILEELLPQYPNSSVLLKIDCEGEEYAIFDSLKGTNYLSRVDGILVEWHEKGYAGIAAQLKEAGFQFLHLPHATANCGMIYGFKS